MTCVGMAAGDAAVRLSHAIEGMDRQQLNKEDRNRHITRLSRGAQARRYCSWTMDNDIVILDLLLSGYQERADLMALSFTRSFQS